MLQLFDASPYSTYEAQLAVKTAHLEELHKLGLSAESLTAIDQVFERWLKQTGRRLTQLKIP